MARALIVGCGCRGRGLGAALLDAGWAVRGTSRTAAGVAEIEAAGIEGALADPDRIADVIDAIEGVAVIFWLLGSAEGVPEDVAALHGPRLERLLEEIVDTPVRGFVYEVTGRTDPLVLERAFEILRSAGERWRIPFEVVDASGGDHDLWRQGMLAAARQLAG